MSKYTTELRYICENSIGLEESKGYKKISEILEECWDKIFDFDFPIFDESYRSVLCIKILKHYYTREISEETVGLWKLRLDAKMNEIMPYYNKLYNVWGEEFNPLNDVDVRTEHTLNRNDTSEGDSTVNNYSLYSDTPQGELNGLEDGLYLTNATKDTGNNEFSQILKSSDEYIEYIKGKRGSQTYGELLRDYRDALINIDMEIIKELNPLFFLLW